MSRTVPAKTKGTASRRTLQGMRWAPSVVIAVVVGAGSIAAAKDVPASGVSENAPDAPIRVDPYEAVHEGNQLFKSGKPKEALTLYERAEREKPDAREIAYAEGLSQYQLGDYEQARALFRKAAAGKNDALADDATYGLGTTYHSDALLSKDDPKAALANLEQAMEHYRAVLRHNPHHAAARDAYRKAGAVWRRMKQQQQQQQKQSSDNKDDKKDQDKNQQQQDNKKKQQDKKQSDQQNQDADKQESSDKQQDQQKQNDQQQNDRDKQQEDSKRDQEEKKNSASKEQNQSQQQQSSKEQAKQVSREQAERKLREMMQALRERKDRRRQPPTRLAPVRPVDKDW